MIDVKTLKRQHEGINDVIAGLKNSIGSADLEGEANEIAQKVSHLAGVLKIHLGTEDRHMYPYLLQSGSDELKKIAQDYVAEMGDISDTFVNYKNRYNTKSKILSDTEGFINETQKILNILEERIKKEDENLYPIF